MCLFPTSRAPISALTREKQLPVTTDYGSCVDDSRGGVSHGEGTEVFRRFNPLNISVSVYLDLNLLVASTIFQDINS